MKRSFSSALSGSLATRITALTLPAALAVAVGAGTVGAGCSGGDGSADGSGSDASSSATGDRDASGAIVSRDAAPAADGTAAENDAGEPSDARSIEDGAVAEDASRDALADAAPGDAGTDAPVGLGLDCGDAGAPNAGPAPSNLGCTGLYASWPSRTLAASVMPFDPGLHLWSDGATKARYIELPPGTKIAEHYGPRGMGAGPTGLASMNLATGEVKFIVAVPFQIGHVQTNPWVPGEIIFCWETGGKSPQRTWTVMADGTGLRPLYPEAD